MDDITGIEKGNDNEDSVLLAANGMGARCIFSMKWNNNYTTCFHRYTADTETYMKRVDSEIQFLKYRESFTLQDYVEV
ncbi:hypothetical protein LCGC14_2046090, partial [marine sediment metagenome]